MFTKKIFPFLLLCLFAIFTGCFDETDLTPKAETDQAAFKSNVPIVPTSDCEPMVLPACSDCKIRLVKIGDVNAEWSIRSYNGGGNNQFCCVNGNLVHNLNYGSNCGPANTQINVWKNLNCGIDNTHLALMFKSRDCDAECEFQPNHAFFEIDCGNGTQTFYINANDSEEEPCDEEIGTKAISVNWDCSF